MAGATGNHVERATRATDPWTRLTATPVVAAAYSDAAGSTFPAAYYRVIASGPAGLSGLERHRHGDGFDLAAGSDHNVAVTDGNLDLDFTATVDQPKISTIEVLPGANAAGTVPRGSGDPHRRHRHGCTVGGSRRWCGGGDASRSGDRRSAAEHHDPAHGGGPAGRRGSGDDDHHGGAADAAAGRGPRCGGGAALGARRRARLALRRVEREA